MGEAYPELVREKSRVIGVLKQEEERFAETLEHGMEMLEGALHREDRMLDGSTVFKLYDTYGFPVDLTADIARERGAAGRSGRLRGRDAAAARAGAGRFQVPDRTQSVEYSGKPTEFHGYETLKLDATVVALYVDGSSVDRLASGQRGVVVLDRTPFYAESGGQVGDRGVLVRHATPISSFKVEDTQKIQAEVFGHHGVVTSGELRLGHTVSARSGHGLALRGHVQPLRDAPHARGAAQSAGPPRAAEGLAGGRAQDPLRLLPRPAAHARGDPRDRAAGERGDPRQRRGRGPRHEATTTPSRRVPWRCSARSTATRCA